MTKTNELHRFYEELAKRYRYEFADDFVITTNVKGYPCELELPENLGDESKVVARVAFEPRDGDPLEVIILGMTKTRDYCDHYLKDRGYENGTPEFCEGFFRVNYWLAVKTRGDMKKIVRDFSVRE